MINIWNEIKEYLSLYPEDFSNPASKEEIINTEIILGLHLSEQYKNFISKYGAAGIGAFYIHGFARLPLMDKDTWSLIDKTNSYKKDQKWPDIEDWYIISDDGRGNPIGCKPDGSVWLSDHDAGFEQIKLADNFEEFLHKLLTDTLYD